MADVSHVKVTVLSVSGETLLDSQCFNYHVDVFEVTSRIRFSTARRCMMVYGNQVLPADAVLPDCLQSYLVCLGEVEVELTAVFLAEISAAERDEYLAQLNLRAAPPIIAQTFATFPQEAREDLELACKSLTHDVGVWDHLSDAMRLEREVVLALVSRRTNPDKISALDERVHKRFRADKELVLAAISESPCCPWFRNCRHATAAALTLQHASEELQADRTVALAALSKCSKAWQHVDAQLYKDIEFLLGLARLDLKSATDSLLQRLPRYTLARKDVAIQVVAVNGFALEHLPPALQDDPEVVLKAVKQDTRALRWASLRLCSDPEFALLAIKNDAHRLRTQDQRKHLVNRQAVCFMHWSLWSDRDFVLQAVRLCPRALKFAPRFQADIEFVMATISSLGRTGCSQVLSFADEGLQDDIVQQALQRSGKKAPAANKRRALKTMSRSVKEQFRASSTRRRHA